MFTDFNYEKEIAGNIPAGYKKSKGFHMKKIKT